MAEQRYCSKCKKTMADTNFYTYKDGTKCELCKACLTMHVNNFDETTFLWILEKFDVPYLPWEWNDIRDKEYQKDPYKFNGMSVFGRYLSKMKLKQMINPATKKYYGWADSEMLQFKHAEEAKKYGEPEEIAKQKVEEMRQAFERGEITESQWLTYKEIEAPKPDFQLVQGSITTAAPGGNPYPVNDNPFEQVELPDVGNDLTPEDKIYLAMKWGRLYSAADWVALEQLYAEYDKSFDLNTADLISGTKQLCKLDLKCNQALDSGDIDSYSKLARASDSLRKSLKFTEAQRKDEKGSILNCYGLIVSYCEKTTGYIPKIDLSVDRDIADKDLRNIKEYNQQLIKDDPAVYKQIESYIKKREILAEQEKDIENGLEELSDEDLANYNASIEAQRQIDNYEDEEDEDI